jgi:stress responsive alpha/beta barrel protein
MIRHVVMWVFPEESAGRTREDNLLRAFELLQALPDAIPLIRRFDVATDQLGGEKQAHLMLDSDFDDWDALETYQQHPAHLEVVAFFREVGTTRLAVDHEVQG